MRTQVALLFAAAIGFGLAACDSQKTASECPDCECDCEPQSDGVTPQPRGVTSTSGVPVATSAADVSTLIASANRHMNHGRGKDCLADLDEAKGLNPGMDIHMEVVRGQCEMLVGECQGGKSRISKWYMEEAAFTKDRANTVAESIGSMRCRGGDSTDRDEILRALTELSDGAYMNKRTPKWCQERVDVVRRLKDKVKPRDVDDGQLSGGVQALFYTGAACFARAGDCKGGLQVYKEFFPKEGLKQLPAGEATKVIEQSFKDSVQRCGG